MKGINQKQQSAENITSNLTESSFSTVLTENERTIKSILGSGQDVMMSKFKIKIKNGDMIDVMLVAIDGIVDENAKRNNVIKPLISQIFEEKPNDKLEQLQMRLSTKKTIGVKNVIKAIDHVLKANVLLLVNGYKTGLLISIEGFEIRAIEEPDTERVVRGAKEGFVESTGVNLSLLRRRISHPSLRFETIEVGEYSKTGVTVCYIKDIAKDELIERIKTRLNQIKIDDIHGSGDIEQLIEDHPYTIFPTVGYTERPDKAAALMMEGRIVILVDGNPISLFAPFFFAENFKSTEDYGARPYYSSFIRFIRFFSFIVTITLPSLYISALNFNKALIPSDMIVPIIQARETVPFPLAMEVILMILMFEIVREAGVRLPQQFGTAISIVGPLILGDVSVSAGLVGAPTVVIVSLSFIAAFVITPIAETAALLRIGLFIASSLFGTYGLFVSLLGLIIHMVSLTSLGIPYMSPFAPFYFRDWKDSIVRFPTRLLKYRPKSVPHKRSRRIMSLPKTGDEQ